MDYLVSLFPSVDAFVLALFTSLLVIHLVFVRKTKLFIDIISVYISFVIVFLLPISYKPLQDWMIAHASIRTWVFVGLVILFHVLFSFSNLKNFSSRVRPLHFLQSLIYRTSIIGFMFSSFLYFAPATIKGKLSLVSLFLFTSFGALAFWFSFPLFLVFAYRFHTKNGWVE
ncbi:MAG: hypothetical protein COX81_02540 [Candidatus Magasanikbacteria bacterium CG_4_10_14_0_2_um_filter_37_12]|uniref:Uncharacterized protein n=1 Tax=Candidatus Magasanikbacteria bacterium CG_4_10_14_0_2_um_filter_37_12 TaxID=1974637 RepID=A0A2M7V7U0_9BACT|nr:MAG: hypothetical protein COX81_02540 [Candidatus Magasanikbacteria bacterium CG_4_10_14_0_2_um_filter_37_12]